MMAPWHGYDHYEMAPLLDVVGMDYYPYADASQVFSYQPADVEFNLAYTRAIAGGQPFWLLETSLTAGRQFPPRGRLAEWTWRQIAHGANLLNFFRWDTPPFGGEEADLGLIGPGTWTPPYFTEVRDLCHQVQRLAPLLAGSVPQRAEVGVLFSFPSWWKHLDHAPCRRLSPHPMHGYPLLVIRHCHGLLENGVAFDLLGPEQSWAGYRWLVVPHCAVMPPALLARLAEFIRQGGSVLLTATSGLFDGDACAHPAPYPPAPLGELFGIATGCQGNAVAEADELTAAWPGAALVFHPEHWVDRLQLAAGTEVWMEYADPLYRSEPALTCRRHGKGQALYLGTAFPRAEMGALYGLLLGRVPVRPGPYQAGVCQRSRVTADGREVRFLQNLTEVPAEINLEAPATDAFTGNPLPERFHLAGRTTRILILAAAPAP
jgi:beta-galactosidase